MRRMGLEAIYRRPRTSVAHPDHHVHPWRNGRDLTRRPAGKWIIDFGWRMAEADAALYEQPFAWAKERVHPMRRRNRREAYR